VLRIPRLGYRKEHQLATTIFKHREAIYPHDVPALRFTAFYVVTNVPEGGRAGLIAPGDGARAGGPRRATPTGAPRYPNGEYAVTVWAYDFKGNVASRQDTVRVRN
jgi:hypothetical protein